MGVPSPHCLGSNLYGYVLSVYFFPPLVMLIKPGSPCLSDSRKSELLTKLKALVPSVTTVHAEYVHFADVEGALTAQEDEILTRLLKYGPKLQTAGHEGTLFLVLPRRGTISPWSTKATDIAHNCTLSKIKRLERGIAFYVGGDGGPLAASPQALQHLHDRMTQRLVASLDEAQDLFFEGEPGGLRTVDVVGKGRAAPTTPRRTA